MLESTMSRGEFLDYAGEHACMVNNSTQTHDRILNMVTFDSAIIPNDVDGYNTFLCAEKFIQLGIGPHPDLQMEHDVISAIRRALRLSV